MTFYIDRASVLFYERPCEEAYHGGSGYNWMIDLDFSELEDFIRKYGAVIIRPAMTKGEPWVLTIYDDYVE